MSEILLKNIEFPKEGTLTLVITSSGEVYRIPRKYYRNETVAITGSKAVVLPPHGDLIDRSKLHPDIYHDWNGFCVPEDDYSAKCIKNAPTVLEASK